MTIEVSRILEELTPFADLGTDRPRAASSGHRLMVRMIRLGEELELQFDKTTGKVTERSPDAGGQTRTYASYRSLLASERFGNLRQWTSNQRRSLQHFKSAYTNRIPVTGLLSGGARALEVDGLDEFLVAQDHGDESVRVMLIDGPAGIGKTTFIEFLAWSRADDYFTKQHPLILHVKSRGRILSYIQDLIAFSLQRLRLNLTFDQLPVLVRHGLVMLSWIAEVAAPEELDDDTLRALTHRAAAVAFLENDETPRYRRFSHSNLFNHFLGMEILDSVARKEVPKCVRRNVLGADFLATFGDLTLNMALHGSECIREFHDAASEVLQNYPWSDRGAANLGTLLITMLPSMDYEGSLELRNIHADEAVIRGTPSVAEIYDSSINQLDIQGANIEPLEFHDCHVTTLTVNETTQVSDSIPVPSRIQYNRYRVDRSKVISFPEQVRGWLHAHGPAFGREEHVTGKPSVVPNELRQQPILRLLERACRSRSFWIPDGSTNFLAKFTRDPSWPDLLALLQTHNLVKEETIAAAGINRRFFHIKRPIRILTEDVDDDDVKSFYAALVARMRDTA